MLDRGSAIQVAPGQRRQSNLVRLCGVVLKSNEEADKVQYLLAAGRIAERAEARNEGGQLFRRSAGAADVRIAASQEGTELDVERVADFKQTRNRYTVRATFILMNLLDREFDTASKLFERQARCRARRAKTRTQLCIQVSRTPTRTAIGTRTPPRRRLHTQPTDPHLSRQVAVNPRCHHPKIDKMIRPVNLGRSSC